MTESSAGGMRCYAVMIEGKDCSIRLKDGTTAYAFFGARGVVTATEEDAVQTAIEMIRKELDEKAGVGRYTIGAMTASEVREVDECVIPRIPNEGFTFITDGEKRGWLSRMLSKLSIRGVEIAGPDDD